MILLAVKLRPAWTRSDSTSPLPLRSFVLELALERRGRDGRARRALGRREDDRAAGDRGPRAARARADRLWRPESGSTATQGVDLPPEERSVGLVFQEYALFPHLDVRRNVAFGGAADVDGLLAAVPDRATSRVSVRRALGGRAPARRPRACPRARPGGAAPRRAAVGARRAHEDDAFAGAARAARRTAACRRSSSRTTSRTRRRSRTGSACVVDGQLVQVAAPDELARVACRRASSPASAARTCSAASRRSQRERPRRGHARRRRAHLLDRRGRGRRDRDRSTRGRSRSALEAVSDSALNHIWAEITSLVPVANRVRVGLGPLVAEVTAVVGGAPAARHRATSDRVVQGRRNTPDPDPVSRPARLDGRAGNLARPHTPRPSHAPGTSALRHPGRTCRSDSLASEDPRTSPRSPDTTTRRR